MAVLSGADHVFALANDAYLKLVQHRPILGKPVRLALPELDGQCIYDLLDGVYTSGEPYHGRKLEVQLDRGNGQGMERRILDFVYLPLKDADGRIQDIFVEGVDVTDHALTEERVRVAQEAGGGGTFEWYPSTGKLVVSDAYRRIWGFAPDVEVTAELLLGRVDPAYQHLAGPNRIGSESNPLRYSEYLITRTDNGERRWIAQTRQRMPAAGRSGATRTEPVTGTQGRAGGIRAGQGRGCAAPGAQDGSGRPAGQRRGTRLQQRPADHFQQPAADGTGRNRQRARRTRGQRGGRRRTRLQATLATTGVCAPAAAAAGRHRPRTPAGRHGVAAAARPGRPDRARPAPHAGPLECRGGPQPARERDPQHGDQCARRDGRQRAPDDRRRQRRCVRRPRAPVDRRHGLRHDAGSAREDFGAVLYDQGARRRHGAGHEHGVRFRQAKRRRDPYRQQTRSRNDDHDPAPAPTARPCTCRPRAKPACRAATKPSWWSTTTKR